MKGYIDTVLSHHALDGVYYDWNVALYCHNPRHVGGEVIPSKIPSMGAHAFSPLGHWDMDELVDLMEWTRKRVGQDGLVIVHNTMVPCAAIENFADYVVAMEWGYGKLSTGAPDLADLPLGLARGNYRLIAGIRFSTRELPAYSRYGEACSSFLLKKST
jgi:hypothetical protein